MKMKTVVGVDLGGTNVRAGRMIGGKMAAFRARKISAQGSADLVLDELRDTIAAVFDGRVSAIGIGVPSLVDVEKGIVFTVGNIPSWQKVPLKNILEREFSVPVQVNNDANCFALGEFRFGAGRGCRNMVGMVLGTGLGAGIIINGRLYCGSHCGAGEIGKIGWREHTVEYYGSGQFFRQRFGMDGADVYARARGGDSNARAMFSAYGEELAQALMVALYAFDPDMVVLGGSVSRAWPFFKESLRRRMAASFAYPHALARVPIQPSRNPRISILGAAALCADPAT
jgi:glucokinase